MDATNISEKIMAGPELWNFFNALAFLILIGFIFVSIFYGLSKITHMAEIKKNWKKYRCEPSIMPFASFYGYNTADNFNYCMGNIFTVHSSDITSSFSSLLGDFTSILSVMMGSINSIRVAVATLGGGVNVIFQDFTDRISTFFFRLRLSAIRMKMLMQRMYATMFSVMYMGLSGITATTNFSNTILFSFLDTFCFPPSTTLSVLGKGEIPISDVMIGDTLLPTYSKITAKFHFSAKGQPMVRLNSVKVSSNHYVLHENKWIRADEHPDAEILGPYEENSLVCLNTDNHILPVGSYKFRDYDETSENSADERTMKFIEERINGTSRKNPIYNFKEYYPSIQRSTGIRMADGSLQEVANITLGSKLSTGGEVIGIVQRVISEYCILPSSICIASSTLIWSNKSLQWKRAGDIYRVHREKEPIVFVSLFVTPSSQIELADGSYIRDSMELCSPDAETYYAEELKQLSD